MLQCRMLGVRHMLEIGTLGGHSAVWCTAANPDIMITTIEIQPKYPAVARENLRTAGVAERVEVIASNAQDILPQLASKIGSRKREVCARICRCRKHWISLIEVLSCASIKHAWQPNAEVHFLAVSKSFV